MTRSTRTRVPVSVNEFWAGGVMGANELSALLWRERELLELLVFKLEEEQLLLQGRQVALAATRHS